MAKLTKTPVRAKRPRAEVQEEFSAIREETIAGQTAQVAPLQKQLDQAKQRVQEIALQAIEGAPGAKALAHINQIAMEQAKPRSPQN
jgi:hypothetical protein